MLPGWLGMLIAIRVPGYRLSIGGSNRHRPKARAQLPKHQPFMRIMAALSRSAALLRRSAGSQGAEFLGFRGRSI